MKKLFLAISLITLIVMTASVVFAATTDKFEVVDDQVCTIKINDYCDFEKKMISYDLEKRQVTIQLKITNNSIVDKPNGEVMLVLDDSNSMNEQTSTGKQRGELVFGAAKALVTKLLSNSDNVKIGIVKFSTNPDLDLEGTIQDASLVSELTNNESDLLSAIDNIEKIGIRTDLDSGLTLATNYFSNENTNKYIVVLTDGVPNVALDLGKTNQGYKDSVINKTKSTLQSLAENYNIITMLTGISNADSEATGSTYTYGQIIEKVFGTADNPTAGKFYYISDSQIENTVNNDIYSDLLSKPQAITDIKINDYFPQEIVDNFDFAYVSEPTKGTISQSIDSENKIVWSLDNLGSGETATVQYTLTLKDNYSSDIVNRVLDTNEKIDITYKDFDGTNKNKTSDDTPKVKITQIKTPDNTPSNDPTTSNTILPKAGSTTIMTIILILTCAAGISGIKMFKLNNIIHK
ncbi:MAG: VWA domain-containing protein [Clostridia bacterium]|nr:VWA domain-containing protein [Clostridia bacterium]